MAQDPLETSEHRSLTRPTLRGIFWLTATRGLKAPLNLVAIAVLARLLTPSDFGIVAIAVVVASFSDMLVDGSFSMVLIQRRKIDAKLIGATLALSAGLATLFAAAIVVSAPFIDREFDFPQLREVLLFLSAMLPITAITTVTTALLQRALQFRVLALNATVSQLIYTASAIGLAVGGLGIWSLVWAQMLAWAVESLMGFLAVRNRYRLQFSTSAVRDVLHSGGMFTAAKMLKWASNSVDRIIVGRLLGAAELGFYSRAITLMRTARQLAGAGPLRVLFSSFAKIQHDPARMQRAYSRALSLSLIASMLMSAFVVVNAELIIRILLGPKWLTTIPLMQILFFAFVAKSGAVVAEAVPLALGRSGAIALREGVQLVLVMIGAAIGAQFGVIGATVGVATAYWLFYLVALLLVQRLLQPGLGKTLRLHLNSFAIALIPLALSLISRWFSPGDSLLLKTVPALVFGLAAIVTLAFGPARFVGDDIVRARAHLWDRLSPHVLRLLSGF